MDREGDVKEKFDRGHLYLYIYMSLCFIHYKLFHSY